MPVVASVLLNHTTHQELNLGVRSYSKHLGLSLVPEDLTFLLGRDKVHPLASVSECTVANDKHRNRTFIHSITTLKHHAEIEADGRINSFAYIAIEIELKSSVVATGLAELQILILSVNEFV